MDTIPQDAPQKQCTYCGKTFPATTEFYHRNKLGRYGLTGECKPCTKARNKNWRERPDVRERQKKLQKDYRSQTEVQEHYREHRKEFYSRPDVQERRRAYREEYKNRPGIQEHEQARQKAYLQRPEIKAHRQAHRKLYDNQPEIQEKNKAYRKEYLAAYRSKNRDQLNEKKKIYYHRPDIHAQYCAMRNEWYKTPEARDILRERNQRRRARKINAPGTHTIQQIQEQLKRQRHKCYYCSAKLEKKNGKYIYHTDHIIPLSRGGSDNISNLVATCPFCNLSKHDRLPHEWPQGNRLL